MARRALYLSTALTVLVLAAPAYAASPREDLVEGWLKSLAGSFGTSVKSSSYDPALQMVNLEGVRIGDVESGFELDIDTLSVTDPRDAPDVASLWTILDLTPGGRGTDWYPSLEY